ncbi:MULTISPECIES: hypothetical protein [unclassified Arenibacter]|nr:MULTISPECIES: hypothetical protein [unclassified Arenibacter]
MVSSKLTSFKGDKSKGTAKAGLPDYLQVGFLERMGIPWQGVGDKWGVSH